MDNDIHNLDPRILWNNFFNLSQIPRPSQKCQKISEYIKKFAERLGLEQFTDDYGNIIIRKRAALGMENREGIILQAHLDMVTNKDRNINYDPENDPITPYNEGEWVRAKGTTLGADNGIGVAAALAILELKGLVHGPIEVLFTIDEEAGMTGAFNLKSGLLKGEVLLNLDSETEGELYIGSAGSIITNIIFRYEEVPVPDKSLAYRINITGLKGGHSGLDINLGRGNSNKIINRLLWYSSMEHDLRLSQIWGGNSHNSIPRESNAIVVIPTKKKEKFIQYIEQFSKTIKDEFSYIEPDLMIEASPIDLPKTVMDKTSQDNFFKAIYGCPNGITAMSLHIPDMVETSTNLGVVKSGHGLIEIQTLQRSSIESAKADLANMIRSVFELAGAEVETTANHPGWKPNLDSQILKSLRYLYEKRFGFQPTVKVIHAGLECGIITSKYPLVKAVSIGPTIKSAHSTNEKVNIESVSRFWEFLLVILKNVEIKK